MLKCNLIFAVLLAICLTGCVTDETFTPDNFGNNTHRGAINFLLDECGRHTLALNRELQSSGQSRYMKGKDKVPKSDKELRLVYIRFQKVLASQSLLYQSTGDGPTYNARITEYQKLSRELERAIEKVESRPGGFKVKK